MAKAAQAPEEPKVPEEPMDERTRANVEAMKIVATPAAVLTTVPEILDKYKPLFFEKGLNWVWRELHEASGASEPPTEPVTAVSL